MVEPRDSVSHLLYSFIYKDATSSCVVFSTFLSREDFTYFAELCFKMFGDRVKHWVTFNEPNLLAKLEYFIGGFPPNRCSEPHGKCDYGNSSTEPYIAAHNMILAHAKANNIYRKNYKVQKTHLDQKGVGTKRVLVLKSSWKLYKLFFLLFILLSPSKVAQLELQYI
jgi:hypothetical protein